jgi:putative acetyltransferase
MLIRPEEQGDWDAVHELNVSAFETDAEARLVSRLREEARPVISLVAEHEAEIVGHIIFSPVALSGHPDLKMLGLGPMSVRPKHQRNGIGSALVRAGLEQSKQLGFGAVVLVGHPEFYPRFGFRLASRFHITCEFDVPEEAFMALELHPGFLADVSGSLEYHPAFRASRCESPWRLPHEL